MLVDDEADSGDQASGGRCPVDLQLEWVLGKMPQKEFKMERLTPTLQPLALPAGLTVKEALDRVLRLPAVASKRYLTNKVCVFSLHVHLCCTPSLSLEVHLCRHFLTLHAFTPSLPSGGPVCDWAGCPATVRWPSSHPVGRRSCYCSVSVEPRGGSDGHRRAAN